MSTGTDAATAPELRRAAAPPLPDMPRRVLINFTTICNLKCPFCFLHGSPEERAKVKHANMKPEEARRIIDEIGPSKPVVQPNLWSEPLLVKHLSEHIAYMKERGIAVCMNTNGLPLTEEKAREFVAIGLDTIFFSIDAFTPPMYQKIRGVDALAKLTANVEMMLRVRGDAVLPRIGVTFTQTAENAPEREQFVDYWSKRVDVVRIGLVIEKGHGFHDQVKTQRVPCAMLYETMPIQANGDVSICCHDSLGEYTVGNVIADGGVRAVWHGEAFQEIRRLHEEGNYSAIGLCAQCNVWAGLQYDEEEKDGLLIRRSAQYTYYNRLDRMQSWQPGSGSGSGSGSANTPAAATGAVPVAAAAAVTATQDAAAEAPTA